MICQSIDFEYLSVQQQNVKCLLAALLLLFTLASCKKKDEYYDVDSDIAAAFTYPHGSYWIFKDSATSTLDSVAYDTTYTSTEIIGLDARTTKHGTWHFTNLHEYIDGVDSCLWQFQMLNNGEHNSVSLIVKFAPNYASILLMAYNPLFSRPIINGFMDGSEDHRTNQLELLPSLSVNNTVFPDVWHAHYYSDPPNGRPDEDIYFTFKTGIIKYVQHCLGVNRTLELERWHVPR